VQIVKGIKTDHDRGQGRQRQQAFHTFAPATCVSHGRQARQEQESVIESAVSAPAA